jgi:hypothetical protein
MRGFLILAGLLALAAGCSSQADPYRKEVKYTESDLANARIEGAAAMSEIIKEPEVAPPQPPDAGFTGGEEYIDEKDIPAGTEFGRSLPRVVIDGVKLNHERGGGFGYVDAVFGAGAMFIDVGTHERQLSTGCDYRADSKDFKNKDGDILVQFKDESLQIMQGGKWRPIETGDPLHDNAAKYLIKRVSLTPDRSAGVARIGESKYWAKFEGKGGWVIADPATFPHLLAAKANREAELIRDNNLSENWRDRRPQTVQVAPSAP